MLCPMQTGPIWISYIKAAVIMLLLTRATVTDLKRKEIEYWVSGAIFGLGILTCLFGFGPAILDSALAAAASFIIFLVFSLFGKGGGGDTLLMTATAVSMGTRLAFVSMAVAGIAGVIFGFTWQKKRNENDFPFAPSIQIGVAAALIVNAIF